MELDHDACYRVFLARDVRFDGKLFVGVRTTGIYCRPICPAPPPKQINVAFYASAAAAQEAGFRPCLRCRPEVCPDFAAWQGTSSTVARALRLIEGGALDTAGVDDLAYRLGVGARQLRRLFITHLGAPPSTFAQTRRVHLAKQLIHETDLPMIDVAMAAGYRSVRRFNESFVAMFGRPPASLRASRQARAAVGHEAGITLRLAFAAPYDWPAMIETLAARAIPGVECVREGRYYRNVDLGGSRGTVSVGPPREGSLVVVLDIDRLEVVRDVVARVRRLFDLAADPEILQQQLGSDPELGPLLVARPGLRVAGSWDGFELGVRTILGENLARAAPREALGRIVRMFGARQSGASVYPDLTHVFPTPERLCDADLDAAGIEPGPADAIRSFARLATDNPDFLGFHVSMEKALERLRGHPSIDTRIAVAIATRLTCPTDDSFGIDAQCLERDAFALFEGRREFWRPWSAYAAVHLLAARDNRPEGAHAVAA
jgi:AraC family transcriptional regulator, regulatory protein of adaptative response / DNA-3-methyladenine glycosylase II